MSPERRQFLEDALKSLTIDVVEQLSKAMMTLMDKSSSEEDQVQSLEVVTNFVEDIDTANGKKRNVNLTTNPLSQFPFQIFLKLAALASFTHV